MVQISFKDKKAVIFDLDGLLIDSEPLWQEARKTFFEKYHLDYNAISSQEVMGAGVRDNVLLYKEKLGLQGDTEQLVVEYRQTFYDLALRPGKLQLCEGAMELLTFLSDRNYTLAIATGGHTREMVEKILVSLEIRKPFSLFVSSDEVKKGKPDPEVYVYTLTRLSLQPADAVVFEDSQNGTLSGKAAGVAVVGVNSDQNIRKALHDGGADVVLQNLREALPLFT